MYMLSLFRVKDARTRHFSEKLLPVVVDNCALLCKEKKIQMFVPCLDICFCLCFVSSLPATLEMWKKLKCGV